MANEQEGILFPDALQREIKDKFLHVVTDPDIGERLFFDNAGGAFRLKRAVERAMEVDAIPDCPERIHKMALKLQKIEKDGTDDARLIFNAPAGGSVLTHLTASQTMFDMVRAVSENVPGKNMVTSVLEHPSAFDCMVYYAKKMGRELRVAQSNPKTGGVDVDSVVDLVDKDTALLSVMYASNITGAIYDMESIVRERARRSPTCTSSATRSSTLRMESSIFRRHRSMASISLRISSMAAADRGSVMYPSGCRSFPTTSSAQSQRATGPGKPGSRPVRGHHGNR